MVGTRSHRRELKGTSEHFSPFRGRTRALPLGCTGLNRSKGGTLACFRSASNPRESRENSQSGAKNQLPLEKVILAFHGCWGATGDVRRFWLPKSAMPIFSGSSKSLRCRLKTILLTPEPVVKLNHGSDGAARLSSPKSSPYRLQSAHTHLNCFVMLHG